MCGDTLGRTIATGIYRWLWLRDRLLRRVSRSPVERGGGFVEMSNVWITNYSLTSHTVPIPIATIYIAVTISVSISAFELSWKFSPSAVIYLRPENRRKVILLHFLVLIKATVWRSEELSCPMHVSANRISHDIEKQFLTTKIQCQLELETSSRRRDVTPFNLIQLNKDNVLRKESYLFHN